jgi:hypothetical protein
MAIDYRKIDAYLATRKGKTITASMLAHAIGVERIYGPTMAKLVRDNCITPWAEKGFYLVNGR